MKKLLIVISAALLFFACIETPEKYSVTYYGNGNSGGSPPVDNNRYASGEYAAVLGNDTLEKAGYKFSGWNTGADNSGTRYNGGDKIKIEDADIFLYAVWSEAPIGIDFN